MKTILIVENSDVLRQSMARTLRRANYSVLEARTSEDAIAHHRTHAEEIGLAICDMHLPGEHSGVQTAVDLIGMSPGLYVLFLSDISPDDPSFAEYGLATLDPHSYVILPKPFHPDQLVRQVRGMF